MSRSSRFLAALAAVAALLAAGAASAQRVYDPPGRVARISDMRGYVSYSPGGDGEWYDAHRNRPLVRGDALWSDRGARAELQAGSTWLRMDEETSIEILQLDDRMLQVEVAEGTVNVRVRRLYPGQRIEIDTPNLAFVIDRPGNFRLDVDREADNTTIEARQGGGRVYGVGGRFDVRNGDVVVFYGEDVRDYELYAFPGQDGFDRYVRQRDQRIDRSLSLRYLGDDLIGYSDLDDYGRWSRYPDYGNVWFPSNVYAGWAPYQDGQWVWQDPWGWTWVDDQPWGFAPSHYGRWAWIDGRWGWVPGPRSQRPVYAPALVAFLELAGGAIGWFPLGPSDVYYPTYNVSSNYFRAVNIANTVVNTTTVNNGYTRYGRASAVPFAQGGYRNRSVPTAVTVVPQDVFVNSRPVRQARREARELAATPGRAPELRRTLGVRPGRSSVLGAAPRARVRPPRAVEDEQVIVHNAPPATTAPTAGATPAPAAPVRERQRRIRQLNEQQTAVDARARGPRREGDSAAAATPPATPAATTPAAAPGGRRLQALDREALPRARERRGRDRGETAPTGERPADAAPAPAAPAATAPAAPVEPARRAEEARAAQQQREEQRRAQQAEREAEQARREAGRAQREAQQQAQAQAGAAREADDARAAQEKARAEQREAMEAQRKAAQEQRESERALREAQQQQAQAQAENDARQQRETAEAEAKAVQERQQAREAQREAQRQQREAQQAQREAARQQAEAAAAAAPAAPAAPVAPPAAEAAPPADAAAPVRGQRRECVPQQRVDAMRARGVAEEELGTLMVCPAQP